MYLNTYRLILNTNKEMEVLKGNKLKIAIAGTGYVGLSNGLLILRYSYGLFIIPILHLSLKYVLLSIL